MILSRKANALAIVLVFDMSPQYVCMCFRPCSKVNDLFRSAVDNAKHNYLINQSVFKTVVAERIVDDANGDGRFHEIGECLVVKNEQVHDSMEKPKFSHYFVFKNQDLPTHVVKNPKNEATAHARIKFMVNGRWYDPFEMDSRGKYTMS